MQPLKSEVCESIVPGHKGEESRTNSAEYLQIPRHVTREKLGLLGKRRSNREILFVEVPVCECGVFLRQKNVTCVHGMRVPVEKRREEANEGVTVSGRGAI